MVELLSSCPSFWLFFLTVFNIERSLDVWLLTIVFVLFGLIGFIDDFIKLFMKRNLD